MPGLPLSMPLATTRAADVPLCARSVRSLDESFEEEDSLMNILSDERQGPPDAEVWRCSCSLRPATRCYRDQPLPRKRV